MPTGSRSSGARSCPRLALLVGRTRPAPSPYPLACPLLSVPPPAPASARAPTARPPAPTECACASAHTRSPASARSRAACPPLRCLRPAPSCRCASRRPSAPAVSARSPCSRPPPAGASLTAQRLAPAHGTRAFLANAVSFANAVISYDGARPAPHPPPVRAGARRIKPMYRRCGLSGRLRGRGCVPRPPPRVPSVRRLPFVGDARPSLRSVRATPPRLPSHCRPARPSVVGSLPRPSLRSGRCASLRPSGGAPLTRYHG